MSARRPSSASRIFGLSLKGRLEADDARVQLGRDSDLVSKAPFRLSVVAIVLGDAYQCAVLGIVEEGDSEAFEQQIAAAVAYAESRRA